MFHYSKSSQSNSLLPFIIMVCGVVGILTGLWTKSEGVCEKHYVEWVTLMEWTHPKDSEEESPRL
jgi:hypothetical protein